MNIFETQLIVNEKDLDELNHVNNVRYVQWVQDIAEKHWNLKASSSIKEHYFWVMLSHYIQYKGQAILGDKLTLRTYVIKSEGVTSTRIVEIFNSETNKLITTSKTDWCLMSTENLKPTRITNELIELFN